MKWNSYFVNKWSGVLFLGTLKMLTVFYPKNFSKWIGPLNRNWIILLQFLCLTNTSKNAWPLEQIWGPNHMGPYQSEEHVHKAKNSCFDLTTPMGLNQKITGIQSICPDNSHLDRWLTVCGMASCKTERWKGGGSLMLGWNFRGFSVNFLLGESFVRQAIRVKTVSLEWNLCWGKWESGGKWESVDSEIVNGAFCVMCENGIWHGI